MRESFDYIVVGAGAAGSVVAARLAEAGSCSILVLEAGPSDAIITIRMPGAQAYPLIDRARTWRYETGPEPHLNGRIIAHQRGKVIGGSSSINGMVFVRGNPRDYDSWAAQGLPDWSYSHCLPYFKKLESYDGGENDYRGSQGPMSISTMKADLPLFQAFLAAGQQAGQRYNSDYNAYCQEGVHIHQANIDRGIRDSAGRAYLRPALKTGLVTLKLGAHVLRVRFDGRRAIGVDYRIGDDVRSVDAEREVILSGGAFNSPQLLLLSGVGSSAQLAQHDIAVVADIPSVGRNLQDHVAVPVAYRSRKHGVSPGTNMHLLKKAMTGAQWLFGRTGLGATNLWETGSFFKAHPESDYVDIQHEFVPLIGDYSGGMISVEDGFYYSTCLMRPKSRGVVRLQSADPGAHPLIVNNYLEHGDDRRVLVAGVRHTDEIIHQPAWDEFRGDGVSPPLRTMSDAQIGDWLNTSAGTQYHPCGTCRMGVGDDAVVDAEGRVHGLECLRVIDASIMPAITSGNLHAPTLMIAEKIADRIKGYALAPQAVGYAGQVESGGASCQRAEH